MPPLVWLVLKSNLSYPRSSRLKFQSIIFMWFMCLELFPTSFDSTYVGRQFWRNIIEGGLKRKGDILHFNRSGYVFLLIAQGISCFLIAQRISRCWNPREGKAVSIHLNFNQFSKFSSFFGAKGGENSRMLEVFPNVLSGVNRNLSSGLLITPPFAP